MTSHSRILRSLGGCLAAAVLGLGASASTVAAQEEPGVPILHACYIPGSGVVYRVSPDGTDPKLPDSCKSKNHVLFSWNAKGADGAAGADGADGADGLSCWDSNGNGVADQEEDRNGDGAVDVLDCLGEGMPGADGQDGADGISCWDLNANGVADSGEDLNNDGVVDALDCRGPQGADGAVGAEGPQGPVGPQGPQGPAGAYQCRLPGAPVPSAPFGALGGLGAVDVPYASAPVDVAGADAAALPRRGIDPFLGEMMLVPYNFAPRDWAFAEGQLLPINTNQALFALLGTMYGGDGRTSFALPDLRGLEPVCGMHWVIALVGIFPSRN